MVKSLLLQKAERRNESHECEEWHTHSDSLSSKAFIPLHSVAQTKSDRSCVKNDKGEAIIAHYRTNLYIKHCGLFWKATEI